MPSVLPVWLNGVVLSRANISSYMAPSFSRMVVGDVALPNNDMSRPSGVSVGGLGSMTLFRGSNVLPSTFLGRVAVSYTHLTLPTTAIV